MDIKKRVYVYFESKKGDNQCSTLTKDITPIVDQFLTDTNIYEDFFEEDSNGFVEVDEKNLSDNLDTSKTYAIRCLMLGIDDSTDFSDIIDNTICVDFFEFIQRRFLSNKLLTLEEQKEIIEFISIIHAACSSVKNVKWSIGILKYNSDNQIINAYTEDEVEAIIRKVEKQNAGID